MRYLLIIFIFLISCEQGVDLKDSEINDKLILIQPEYLSEYGHAQCKVIIMNGVNKGLICINEQMELEKQDYNILRIEGVNTGVWTYYFYREEYDTIYIGW